jgi:glycosyltransferase involved in cell wall biosynthesis
VNGYLLPVQDPQALADTLLALIDAPDERVRMGKNGLEKVRKTFDWDHTVAAYLAVYDQLLGRTAMDKQNQGNNTDVNQARVG